MPLDIQQIPMVDAAIISHDHYDHLNKFSVQRLIEKSNKFIVPRAVGAQLKDWGVPQEKIVELDWWQEYRLDQNLMMVATPAQHFSGRGITDRNKALWASWVIKTPFHKIFFSGDSGYFGGFKKIGDKYNLFDLTFMECGAYGKPWPKVHMFPEQTVQLTYGLLRMQWETIQDLKDGSEEKVALRTQEWEDFLNKVKSGSQSRLDRLHQHAENINKLDNFSDDFTILEVAFG